MAWRLKILFDDGTDSLLDEEFDTEQDARNEYQSWLDNWAEGRETPMLAGEDYDESDIEDCEIWEE